LKRPFVPLLAFGVLLLSVTAVTINSQLLNR
jgi:hypothetical protein